MRLCLFASGLLCVYGGINGVGKRLNASGPEITTCTTVREVHRLNGCCEAGTELKPVRLSEYEAPHPREYVALVSTAAEVNTSDPAWSDAVVALHRRANASIEKFVGDKAPFVKYYHEWITNNTDTWTIGFVLRHSTGADLLAATEGWFGFLANEITQKGMIKEMMILDMLQNDAFVPTYYGEDDVGYDNITWRQKSVVELNPAKNGKPMMNVLSSVRALLADRWSIGWFYRPEFAPLNGYGTLQIYAPDVDVATTLSPTSPLATLPFANASHSYRVVWFSDTVPSDAVVRFWVWYTQMNTADNACNGGNGCNDETCACDVPEPGLEWNTRPYATGMQTIDGIAHFYYETVDKPCLNFLVSYETPDEGSRQTMDIRTSCSILDKVPYTNPYQAIPDISEGFGLLGTKSVVSMDARQQMNVVTTNYEIVKATITG